MKRTQGARIVGDTCYLDLPEGTSAHQLEDVRPAAAIDLPEGIVRAEVWPDGRCIVWDDYGTQSEGPPELAAQLQAANRPDVLAAARARRQARTGRP